MTKFRFYVSKILFNRISSNSISHFLFD